LTGKSGETRSHNRSYYYVYGERGGFFISKAGACVKEVSPQSIAS